MKVLLVDDDPIVRGMIRRVVVEAFHAEVCEVDDGLGALELLQEEAFDFVIMDLQMRVVDGMETLQALRRTPAFRALPVVVVTGSGSESNVRHLIGLNVSEIVAKPFTPRTLQQRLAPLVARLQSGTVVTAPVRAKLNLRPTSRLMLVGPKDRFQDFLFEHLHHVCRVDCVPTAAAALREALSQSPDGVFITGDDILLPAALFARKIHRQPIAPRVFLCEPSAAPFSDDPRWFDGRLSKVSTPRGLFKELRPILTDAGLAVALLPPSSPLIEGIRTAAVDRVQAVLQTPIATLLEPPSWESTDQRAVEAWAQGSVDDVSWSVHLLLTHNCGLRNASILGGGTSFDEVSEEHVLAGAEGLARDLATRLRDALLEYDVTSRLGSSAARAATGYGRFHGSQATQWLTVSQGKDFAAAIEVVVTGADASTSLIPVEAAAETTV